MFKQLLFFEFLLFLYNAIGLNAIIVYDINLENSYFNRKVFVRNFEQIYNCPKGWIFLSNPQNSGWKLVNENQGLLINSDSNIGFTSVKCGHITLDLAVIDISQYDMIIFPSVPEVLNIKNDYVFQIFFQPDIINRDKTYVWYAEQTLGRDKIKFQSSNNMLVVHLLENLELGSYGIVIKSQYNMSKSFNFTTIPYVKKERSSMDKTQRLNYIQGLLTGFNQFFYGYIGIGSIVVIFSSLVYVISFFGKRNFYTEFAGYRDVEIEEKELLKQRNNITYTVMDNPMNKEKDLSLFYKLFKEFEANIKGNFDVEPPYQINSLEVLRLKERFPRGVCLNCVKLVGQLIIMDKTDCPFIQHTCDIPPGKNFDKAIDCKCLKFEAADVMDIVNNDYMFCCSLEDGTGDSCDGVCRFAPKLSNNSNIASINHDFININMKNNFLINKSFQQISFKLFKSIKNSFNFDALNLIVVINTNNGSRNLTNKMELNVKSVSKKKNKTDFDNTAKILLSRKRYSTNSTQNLISPIVDMTKSLNASPATSYNCCQHEKSCYLNDKLFECPQCMTEALKQIIKKKLLDDLETSADIKELETEEEYYFGEGITNYKNIKSNTDMENRKPKKIQKSISQNPNQSRLLNLDLKNLVNEKQSENTEVSVEAIFSSYNVVDIESRDKQNKCNCSQQNQFPSNVSQQQIVNNKKELNQPILYCHDH